MNKQNKGFLFVLVFVMVWGILGTTPDSRADVDVHISIGGPPLLVLSSPPTMLFLSEAGVYVAVGIGHDIFFTNGRYYYFHGGNWFWGSGYGGPWIHAGHKSLPPGLKKHKVHHLRMLRDQKHKAFIRNPTHFKGKHFIGNKGPGPKVKSQLKDLQMKKSGPKRNKVRHKR